MNIIELELLINAEVDGLVNGLRHPVTVKHNLINIVKELDEVKSLLKSSSLQLKEKEEMSFEDWLTKNKVTKSESGWLVYKKEEHSMSYMKYKYEEAMKTEL